MSIIESRLDVSRKQEVYEGDKIEFKFPVPLDTRIFRLGSAKIRLKVCIPKIHINIMWRCLS